VTVEWTAGVVDLASVVVVDVAVASVDDGGDQCVPVVVVAETWPDL
jgi:hypothetical protein